MFEAVKLLIKNETTKTNVNFFFKNFIIVYTFLHFYCNYLYINNLTNVYNIKCSMHLYIHRGSDPRRRTLLRFHWQVGQESDAVYGVFLKEKHIVSPCETYCFSIRNKLFLLE